MHENGEEGLENNLGEDDPKNYLVTLSDPSKDYVHGLGEVDLPFFECSFSSFLQVMGRGRPPEKACMRTKATSFKRCSEFFTLP